MNIHILQSILATLIIVVIIFVFIPSFLIYSKRDNKKQTDSNSPCSFCGSYIYVREIVDKDEGKIVCKDHEIFFSSGESVNKEVTIMWSSND